MKDYLNRLSLIFHALVGVPLLAFVFIYLELDTGGLSALIKDPEIVKMLSYILPTISMVLAGIAFILFKKNLPQAVGENNLRTKLNSYFTVIVQKYTLFEASSLLAVAGLFLTGNIIYTIIYLAMLLLLSLHRPTVHRISRDLKLKDDERQVVIHKKEIPEG